MMDVWIDGWMEGWTDGQTEGRKDRRGVSPAERSCIVYIQEVLIETDQKSNLLFLLALEHLHQIHRRGNN